jgi:hypothetical protein
MYLASKFTRGSFLGKKINAVTLVRSLSSSSSNEITVELGDVFETHSTFTRFSLVFELNAYNP